MYKTISTFLLALCAIGVMACAPQTPATASATPRGDSPLPTRLPPDRPVVTPQPEGGAAPAELLEQAIDDLMQRTGARADEIEVLSAEPVTWRDGSLGCAKPGVDYIQVLIDGYRIVLKYAGREYDYHAGPSSIFLCDRALTGVTPITIIVSPRVTPIVGGGGIVIPTSVPGASLVDQAKADLAARLSIDVNSIEVVSAEAVEWADSSLGCPREGMAYLQVITPGTHILLRAGDQVYSYHSGRAGPPFLCENPVIGSAGPGTLDK
jgi:hypothetical protein